MGEVIAELRKYAFDRGHKATNSERLKALELLGKYKAMFTDRQVTEDKREEQFKTTEDLRRELENGAAGARGKANSDAGEPSNDGVGQGGGGTGDGSHPGLYNSGF